MSTDGTTDGGSFFSQISDKVEGLKDQAADAVKKGTAEGGIFDEVKGKIAGVFDEVKDKFEGDKGDSQPAQ